MTNRTMPAKYDDIKNVKESLQEAQRMKTVHAALLLATSSAALKMSSR